MESVGFFLRLSLLFVCVCVCVCVCLFVCLFVSWCLKVLIDEATYVCNSLSGWVVAGTLPLLLVECKTKPIHRKSG
jgi:hypothetical protein